jgi:hypothetical protein
VSGQSASIPVAIVVAGGFIGGGLFFGLRASRPAPPVPSVNATASGASSAGVPEPTAEPSSAAKVLADATAALEAQRPRIVVECWQASAKRQPEPGIMHVVYTFSFNAQGQQLARGISVDRATGRPDVTSCLSTAVHPVTIPPPGAPVSVDVPFTLP